MGVMRHYLAVACRMIRFAHARSLMVVHMVAFKYKVRMSTRFEI